MARTTAKPPRTARLTLAICGVEYAVRPIPPADLPLGVRSGWRLTRGDRKGGRISYDLAAGRCTCEGFRFAKGGAGCKHLDAARVCSLI